VAVAAGLGAMLVAGCADSSPSEPPATAAPVALEVEVASCAGRAGEEARTALESDVGDVLSAYVVDGFLGDYPRLGFVRSFDSFTGAAAASAVRDIELLTASRFARSSSVRATRLEARISCLADDDGGDVVGATAQVAFDFVARGGDTGTQPFGLRGRFMLVREGGEWAVFGYDVARDDSGGSG
jgi:hypothetical protein